MGQLLTTLWSPRKETRNGSVDDVAALLARAQRVCVLTGAGCSKESGIPTCVLARPRVLALRLTRSSCRSFRDPADGLWQRYDPMVYATIWGFQRSPEKIWELLRDFLAETTPRPNAGHVALAELQRLGIVATVVTQNVDNLHQEAGSTGVIEFHGSLLEAACHTCRAPGGPVTPLLARDGPLPPRCAACGGPLKPSAVLFGERIPDDAARQAQAAARACDLMLVIGTSAAVRPAADLPRLALEAGATVVEVNVEATGLTGSISDVILRGKSGVVLPQVLDAVKRLRAGGGGGGGSSGGRAANADDAVPRAALCAQQPPQRRRGGRRALPRAMPRAGSSGCHLV